MIFEKECFPSDQTQKELVAIYGVSADMIERTLRKAKMSDINTFLDRERKEKESEKFLQV